MPYWPMSCAEPQVTRHPRLIIPPKIASLRPCHDCQWLKYFSSAALPFFRLTHSNTPPTIAVIRPRKEIRAHHLFAYTVAVFALQKQQCLPFAFARSTWRDNEPRTAVGARVGVRRYIKPRHYHLSYLR